MLGLKNLAEYVDGEMYINKMVYNSFQLNNFKARYMVYKLIYKGDDLPNFKILNELGAGENVCSMVYNGGKAVYLLVKNHGNIGEEELFPLKIREVYKISILRIEEKDKLVDGGKLDVIYNLLLNGLAGYNGKITNLNGQLYVFAMDKKLKNCKQVVTEKYKITNSILRRTQQSFISYKLRKYRKGRYAKYKIFYGDNNTRKIINTEDQTEDNIFVKGSYDKIVLDYDNLSLDEKKKITRVELLHELISNFNWVYRDICKLEFEKVSIKSKEIKPVPKINKERIKEFASLVPINIVVSKDIELADCLLKTILDFFEAHNLSYEVNRILKEKSSNLLILHDKKYYEADDEIKDEKIELKSKLYTQTITWELLKNSKEKQIQTLLYKVLSELYIKLELNNMKINNWQYGEMEFYLGINKTKKKTKERIIKHYLLKVNKLGEMEIEVDPIKIGIIYTQHINEVDGNNKGINIIRIVRQSENYNLVRHSDYLPIIDRDKKLELDKISKLQGKYRSRSKIYTGDKSLYPTVGKIIFTKGDKLYYTIGEINGLNSKLIFQNNIYCVEPLENEDDITSSIIPEILSMLENYHIRSNRTETVYPFPFKHLLEYVRKDNEELLQL